MDGFLSLQTVGMSSGTVAVLFLLYRAFKLVNERRLVSDCCGRKLEIGIAVREMPTTPETNNPPKVDAAPPQASAAPVSG
jgi:hypothetical protein